MFLKLDHFPHVGIKQMINQNKKSVKPPAIVIQCFFWTKKTNYSPQHIQTTKIIHQQKVHRKTDLCPPHTRCFLVGGLNPFEKYARQIGSSPQGSGWT